jgi:hypothetical protein
MNVVDLFLILFYGAALFFIIFFFMRFLQPPTTTKIVVFEETPTTHNWWPWSTTRYNWWTHWTGWYSSGNDGGYYGRKWTGPGHINRDSTSRPWGGGGRLANLGPSLSTTPTHNTTNTSSKH